MKRYCNNNGRIFHSSKILTLNSKLSVHRPKLFVFCFTLLALCFVLCWVLYPGKANSGPYLDSEHGDTTYGVTRSGLLTFGYSKGNCAHCHEQHASIGGAEPDPVVGAPSKYELFRPVFVDQTDSFCYACHKDPGTSKQIMMPNQYVYSRTAGGDTTIICPDDLKTAFQFVNNSGNPQLNCSSNKGSSHLLDDIETFLTNKWGYDGITKKINPCSGCHNPHRAQKDPHTSTGRIVGGKLVSSVSRPSQHTDLVNWELWGDDSTERMNVYAFNNYWAPRRSGGGYEPDGSLTQDGSNMVDFVSLCTDCHNSTTTINSTRLGRNLYRINWGVSGDFHGGQTRIDDGGDFSGIGEYGDLLDPYKVGGSYSRINYVLSCTDCHEPHGSPNEFLLRKTVNGTQINTIGSEGLWYNWCQACHFIDPIPPPSHLPPVDTTTNCFQGGACHRHCDPPACGPTRLF